MRAASAIMRIAAEKLRRNRVLVFVEVEIALGLLVLLAEHAVGRGELGHDQAASAQVADEAAEDGVGDAGHGGEDRRGGDGDGADGKAGRDGLQAREHRVPRHSGAGNTARVPHVPFELSQNFFTVLIVPVSQN